VLKLPAEGENGIFDNLFLKTLSCERAITAEIVRTLCKVAAGNQSFHNIQSEIDLQKVQGVDMGHTLHHTKACINTAKRISD
jgi:hypothetical protein